MKSGHCKHCPKYPDRCQLIVSKQLNELVPNCKLVNAELNRITCPRRVKRITIAYEHELSGMQLIYWEDIAYAAGSDGDE